MAYSLFINGITITGLSYKFVRMNPFRLTSHNGNAYAPGQLHYALLVFHNFRVLVCA